MGSLEFQKRRRINPSFLDFLTTTCSLLGAWGRLGGEGPSPFCPFPELYKVSPGSSTLSGWPLSAACLYRRHVVTKKGICKPMSWLLWLSAGHTYSSRVSEAQDIIWELKGGRLWRPGLSFCCCCFLVLFEGSSYSCLMSPPLHGSRDIAPASLRWWYRE